MNVSRVIVKIINLSTNISTFLECSKEYPSSTYAGKGEGRPKTYTYCFSDVTLLLKCVRGGRKGLNIWLTGANVLYGWNPPNAS